MSEMIPEMIGLKEASKRTGLSYNALRHMCNDNKCPSIRVGDGKHPTIKVNYTALCKILNGTEEK